MPHIRDDPADSVVGALDAVEYDPIDHLNALFSHPTALSSVENVSATLSQYQCSLDADIASLVAVQTTSSNDSVQRIQDAQTELAALFAKIEGVRERALATEKTITEMTADIKRLDGTKKNLTLSMTALKRLQMLTTAYEQLRGLSQTRQYRECAHLLQAVIQLMAHFKSYRSIDQIAALSKGVADVQRELLEQVCEDFEVTFAKAEVQQKRGMLAEACQVIDALGEQARARLITWYCNTQLREYRQVFRGNDEAGSLDNIARRYSWFNRMLKTYDTEHAVLFPPYWKVNEMLANAFCENTREDYKGILQRSMRRADGQQPDVNLLLSCLQETLDFEHGLERRFSVPESRSSIDTITSSDERKHGFSQAISESFEPYLSIWVESQDKQLSSLIPKYRQQPIRNPEEDFHPQLVIPSSTELFHSYRVTLAQCAKLSTGSRLLDLSQTFAKHLDAYAQQVLLHHLASSPQASAQSVEDTLILLNTADYCYTTTTQLQDKISARIDPDLRAQIDLSPQADAFMGVASAAIRALVQLTETDCVPAWRSMRALPWGRMEVAGDQSAYTAVLLQRIHDRSREILRHIHKPQYARAYCDHLVDALAATLLLHIVAARPISEGGAEQLLLDSYVLKEGLKSLPTLASDPTTTKSATPSTSSVAYTKRLTTTFATRLDPLLKTLQVRSSPPEGLVQAYLIHIRDASSTNFRKILDLKGLTRKTDQTHLLELFNAHKSSPANADLLASNAVIAGLNLSAPPAPLAASTAGGQGLGIGGGLAALKDNALAHSTPSLPVRFDPANFGAALMSAARDAGDRFASSGSTAGPSAGLGGSAVGAESGGRSRVASPAGGGGAQGRASLDVGPAGLEREGTPSLNENLRNLGKFFRRGDGR